MISDPVEFDPALDGARRLERENDWLGSAGLYTAILQSHQHHSFQTAALRERYSFAMFKAAMQANERTEFRDRIQHAIEGYERASQDYRGVNFCGDALSARCQAMIRHLGFWLAPEFEQRRELLEECCAFTNEALELFDRFKENLEFGSTYNVLAWPAMFAATLDSELQTRELKVRRAIEWGEKAVSIFTSLQDETEASRASANVSVFLKIYATYLAAQFQQREIFEQKALAYWEKALGLSRVTALTTFPAIQIVADTNVGWKLGTGETSQLLEEALQCARETGDRLVIGSTCNWAAFNSFWASRETADPEEAIRLREKAIGYYADADHQFERIGYPNLLPNHEPVNYMDLSEFEGDSDKRHDLLSKALESSRRGMVTALQSGHPAALFYAHHVLGKSLATMARTSLFPSATKEYLGESLAHWVECLGILGKFAPYASYDQGVLLNLIAGVRLELANLAEQAETRVAKLQEVIQDKELALSLCEKELPMWEKHGPMGAFATVGGFQRDQGDLLVTFSEIQQRKHALARAINLFEKAAESFRKANLPNRAAECEWKAAIAYQKLGNYWEASRVFDRASDDYRRAAEVAPQLETFCRDNTHYMQAWSKITEAMYWHQHGDFGSAAEAYQKAAQLLKSTRSWSHLAPNYSAWAQIENAEDLSKSDKNDDAAKAFDEAIALLEESKKSLNKEPSGTSLDNTLMLAELVSASGIRQQYCQSRILLEMARAYNKNGDSKSSTEKYEQAASGFSKLAESIRSGPEQQEMRFLATLAKAWQAMTIGEGQIAPKLLLDASKLFDDAAALSPNENVNILLRGHSRFCKAIESGTMFVETGKQELRWAAIQDFESAAAYYAKAGFQHAFDYAEASKLLFDALAYMTLASKEAENDKRAMLYSTAEKILLSSAESFMKAGFTGKKEEVLRLLGKAKTEKILALSLVEVLRTPSLTSPLRTITTALPTPERAVGLELFERAYLHAHVAVRDKSPKVDSPVDVEILLVNAGKSPARLERLEGVVSKDFELVRAPEEYRFAGNTLELRGRRLNPLETVSLKVVLRPVSQGLLNLDPKIVYLDEDGTSGSQQLGPVVILTSSIVEYLVKCFFEDYHRKRLPPDLAGWRSLMEVVGSLKIPRSNVYGDPRYGHTFSKPLEAMMNSNIIESRVFPGERGRGGRVLKIRVRYDRGPVRSLVDEMMLRNV